MLEQKKVGITSAIGLEDGIANNSTMNDGEAGPHVFLMNFSRIMLLSGRDFGCNFLDFSISWPIL